MTEMVITRGLPGSGKSTFAKQWVAEDPENRVRANRDGIRWTQGIRTGIGTPAQEEIVTEIERAIVVSALKSGKSVVIDAMNLNDRFVRPWFKIADRWGAEVVFQDFPTPVRVCAARDYYRGEDGGREVGNRVIYQIADKFKVPEQGNLRPAPKWTPKPKPDLTPAPPYSHLLPDAILVDTDGTVANHEGVRNPYDTSKYAEDTAHENVVSVVDSLALRDYVVIGVSGRSEEFRDVTLQWWREKAFMVPDEFYMRAEGDTRPDDVVKAEIYENHIRGKYNVIGVFDDRGRVLRMWRAKGLTTFAVGDTDNNDF